MVPGRHRPAFKKGFLKFTIHVSGISSLLRGRLLQHVYLLEGGQRRKPPSRGSCLCALGPTHPSSQGFPSPLEPSAG